MELLKYLDKDFIKINNDRLIDFKGKQLTKNFTYINII